MSKTQRITLGDVRRVYTLVNECQELWAEPSAWRRHLLGGISRLTGVSIVGHSRIQPGFNGSAPAHTELDSVGFSSESEWNRLRQTFSAADPQSWPGMDRVAATIARKGHTAHTATELVSRKEWERSALRQDCLLPVGIGELAFSVRLDPPTRSLVVINLNVPVGEGTISVRQRRLLALVHAEVGPLVGTRLATNGQRSMDGLTPRQRQVLDLLLAGCSEKEVAHQLGIATPTAHVFVKQLYQHFQVTSRGELLAYFVHRQPS